MLTLEPLDLVLHKWFADSVMITNMCTAKSAELALASTISQWSSGRLVMTTLRGCSTARVRGEVRCRSARTWYSRMWRGSSPPVLVIPISLQKLLIPCKATSCQLALTPSSDLTAEAASGRQEHIASDDLNRVVTVAASHQTS